MNRNIQTLIAALRNGRYQQTAHYLRDGDCYCFAGVICDLYDPSRWHKNEAPGKLYSYPSTIGNSTTKLPLDALAWIGLNTYELNYFMNKNDRNYSFVELANELESSMLQKQQDKIGQAHP